MINKPKLEVSYFWLIPVSAILVLSLVVYTKQRKQSWIKEKEIVSYLLRTSAEQKVINFENGLKLAIEMDDSLSDLKFERILIGRESSYSDSGMYHEKCFGYHFNRDISDSEYDKLTEIVRDHQEIELWSSPVYPGHIKTHLSIGRTEVLKKECVVISFEAAFSRSMTENELLRKPSFDL